MKAIKYIFAVAAVFGFTLSASAQETNKSVIDQVNKIIKANSPDMEKQIKDAIKDFKKDPATLTAVGRAYLDAKNSDKAIEYADMALKRDGKFGPAYVLKGDSYVMKDDGGAASAEYEQAVYFDPKNPDGYRRYAQINSKASPSAAVNMLERLRQARPDYPVDIISAEIYDRAGNIDKALSYYEKVDRSKMEPRQLATFAFNYYLKGEYEKSLDVAKSGIDAAPRDPALNRIAFYDLTDLKQYAEALQYADALFNRSDSTKTTYLDYLYYGHAYLGNKEYDNAISMFQKSIDNNAGEEAHKLDALKNIADAYRLKDDYKNAIATYQQYLDMKKEQSANDINTLATLYMAEASDSSKTNAEKKELYMKADNVYATMAEKMPSVADFATLQRAHIGFALDPDTKDGLAKPHYEKLVEIILAKEIKEDKDNARLVEAYRYLGYYHLLQNDKTTSDSYWNKVLEIDPENATAKQALGK